MALAKKQGVPPYIICSDATLASMCRVKPQTRERMLDVSGMGEVKTAKYGEAFLQVIREHEAASRRTRAQVEAVALQAQSLAYRMAARSAAKPAPSVRPVPAAPVRPVQPSPPPRIALEDDDECLADAYLSGVSIEEMADELGVSPSEIRHRLREMDLIF